MNLIRGSQVECLTAALAATTVRMQELSAMKTSVFDNFNDSNVACHRYFNVLWFTHTLTHTLI